MLSREERKSPKNILKIGEKRVDKGMEVSYTNQAASRGAAAQTEKTSQRMKKDVDK